MSFLRRLAAPRGSLTKACSKLSDALNNSPVNIAEVKVCRDTIIALNNRLESFNKDIEANIDASETDNLEQEYEKIEHYCTKAFEHIAQADYVINENKANKQSNETTVRLPKISLPIFDGDVLKWQEYIEAFTVGVDKHNISDVEKFQYLKSSLHGEAASTIMGLPMTAGNYTSAIELLKSRYGSKSRVIRAHVRALISLKSPNVKSAPSLRSFIDTVHRHMRGLESLEVAKDNYAIFLCEILLAKVPSEIKHEWAKLNENSMNLEELLRILENESKHQDIISSTKDDANNTPSSMTMHSSPIKIKSLNRSLVVQSYCSFCKLNGHASFSCQTFLSKTPIDRLKLVKEHKLCINCLRNHNIKDCISTSKCKTCNRKHNSLLHFESSENRQANQVNVKSCTSHTKRVTILPTLTIPVISKRGIQYVGVLLDSGSDRSFLCESMAGNLNTKALGSEILNINSFNGSSLAENCPIVQIKVLLDNAVKLPLNLLVSKHMNHIQNRVVKPIMSDCNLPPLCNQAEKIDIIIGADNYYNCATGNLQHVEKELKLIETIFGWTYHGILHKSDHCESYSNTMFVSCVNIDNSLDVRLFWDEQLAGILPKTEDSHNDILDRFVEQLIFTNERYHVRFPWLQGASLTSNYKKQALARLSQTTKRLVKTGIIQDYHQILQDYESNGIIEKCPKESTSCYYIPHHAVVRTQATSTKIRIVFDASARELHGQSINDCLFEGSNLFPSLIGVIIRFRLFEHALTGDIEKAFLQIGIQNEDRDFTRFFWFKNVSKNNWPDGEIVQYRFCRVPFGFRSSPFILNKVIEHHLEISKNQYPDTVQKIKSNIYVDDLIISVDDRSTLQQIATDIKSIFSNMSMNLHKLHSNSHTFDHQSNSCKILGIQWNIEQDTFTIQLPSKHEIVTKRNLASYLCGIFDPLGLLVPFSNRYKLILHRAWLLNLDWDGNLPADLMDELSELSEEVNSISNHQISRWCGYSLSCGDVEIHSFADASMELYCATIYISFMKDANRTSTLLCSKSRLVSKRQTHTIPQLELMAALLSSRLLSTVLSMLPKELNYSVKCFSDSQVVLHWIKSINKRHKIHIQNKVAEIRQLFPPSSWFYIRSKNNPADIGTKQIKLKHWLTNELWWKGPKDAELDNADFTEIPVEEENQLVISSYPNFHNLVEFSRFSSFDRLLNTMSYILRFCKVNYEAKTVLIKTMQQECYKDEILCLRQQHEISRQSSLYQLCPFLDADGILRVQGRLQQSDLKYDMKHPIILDKHHHLTGLIIKNLHLKNIHVGISSLVSLVREQFWVPQCRKTCKLIINKCVPCQRFKSKQCHERFDHLPKERVQSFAMRPFQFVGLDYLGPISTLSNGNKVYILLFTCMQIRALHLEVTLSLSYDEFCSAFSRFISRRGTPTQVRSDNAKTFKAASTKLTRTHRFIWKFNCEKAPWEGGCWERLVRSVKTALRYSLKHINPTVQDLTTLVYHIENIINNRPITFCTGNETDIIPIKPMDFLIPTGNLTTSNEVTDQSSAIKQALSCNTKAVRVFWTRWKTEYLPDKNQNKSTRSNNTVQVGDIMLLNEASKRQHWPLVKILEVSKGRDGKPRSVKILCKGKTFTRPIKLLHPLEFIES